MTQTAPIVWTNQNELMRALQMYKIASKKAWSDILANEGKWFSVELANQFKKVSPLPLFITHAAIQRGYRMGRRPSSLVGALHGLSQASIKRAKVLLAGQKSDWFRVGTGDGGVPVIKLARFGVRATKQGKVSLLRGGRNKNKFAKSAMRASQLDHDLSKRTLAEVFRKDLGLKQLNHRAVATAIEIGYRARSAKGSFMAVQWLPQVYKNRSSSTVKRGPLVTNTRGGKQIGLVEFATGSSGEIENIRITGMVPGTSAVAARHGIVNKAASVRAADRRKYVFDKLLKIKRDAASVGGRP